MARHVIDMSDELAAVLKEKSSQFELPVSGTIKLAIKTLLKISDQLAEGGKVMVEDQQGHITTLWLPQLETSTPKAALPVAPPAPRHKRAAAR